MRKTKANLFFGAWLVLVAAACSCFFAQGAYADTPQSTWNTDGCTIDYYGDDARGGEEDVLYIYPSQAAQNPGVLEDWTQGGKSWTKGEAPEWYYKHVDKMVIGSNKDKSIEGKVFLKNGLYFFGSAVSRDVADNYENNDRYVAADAKFRARMDLTSIEGLELLDVSQCAEMRNMFAGTDLSEIVIPESWKTYSLDAERKIGGMFSANRLLTTVDARNLNVSTVKDFLLTFAQGCMYYTSAARDQARYHYMGGSLETVDISGWDTSSAETLEEMFYGCRKLKVIKGIEGLDTRKVETFQDMFNELVSYEGGLDLSGWNTSSLLECDRMFADAQGIKWVNLSGWDTSKMDDATWPAFRAMFANCSSLTEVDLSGWTPTNSQASYDFMFSMSFNFAGDHVVGSGPRPADQSNLRRLVIPTLNTSSADDKMMNFFNGDDMVIGQTPEQRFSNEYQELVLGKGFTFADNGASCLNEAPDNTRWLAVESGSDIVPAGTLLDDVAALEAYHAQWKQSGSGSQITYTCVYPVSFDAQGGAFADGSGSLAHNVTLYRGTTEAPAVSPTRDGHAFAGWYLSPDCSGDAVDFSSYNADNPLPRDTVLYAKWDAVAAERAVTFDPANGQPSWTVPVADGEAVARPADPAREGFEFLGWLAADGSKWDFSSPVTSDMTLTASWGSEPAPGDAATKNDAGSQGDHKGNALAKTGDTMALVTVFLGAMACAVGTLVACALIRRRKA